MREISIQSKHKDGLSANLSGIFAWELMNKGFAIKQIILMSFFFARRIVLDCGLQHTRGDQKVRGKALL